MEMKWTIIGIALCALFSMGMAADATFLRWEGRFLEMTSRMAQQRGADMCNTSHRLSNALAGIHIHPLEKIPLAAC